MNTNMTAQELLSPRIPELAGPMDESDSGACTPAARDPRPRLLVQPLSTELIDQQNAEAQARHQRQAGIERRALAAVRRELKSAERREAAAQ